MVEFWTGWLHGVIAVPGVENFAPYELLTEDWFCGVLMDDGHCCGTAEVQLSEDRQLPTVWCFADSDSSTVLHTVTELTDEA